MQISKSIFLVAISLLLLTFVFIWFSPKDIMAGFTLVSPEYVGVAACFIILSYLSAFLRFKSLFDNLNVAVPTGQVFKAYSVGHVGNLLFFNIVGQSISRAYSLRNNGVFAEQVVALTYYERIMSAVVLSAGAVWGVIFLFPDLQIDLQLGTDYLIYFFFSLGIVLFSTCLAVFPWKAIKNSLLNFIAYLLQNSRSILLTILTQVFMLLAYVSILLGQSEVNITVSVIAALIIVMFAASLPVSFAGWGIRELSAASALLVTGIDPAVSIVMAIIIGLLSQVLVYAVALVNVIGLRSKHINSAVKNNTASVTGDTQQKLIQFVVFLMSVLIYFQIWVPINNNVIAVNLADVLAFTCLGLFFIKFLDNASRPVISKPLLNLLAGITFVLIFSLILGYVRFGFVNWAFLNRGTGWLVLLGYVSAGILFVQQSSDNRLILLKTIVFTAICISTIQIILYLFKMYNPAFFNNFLHPYISGYAANTNAYAFQLLMSICALFILGHQQNTVFGHRLFYFSLLVISINLFCSYSRAGSIMYLILCLAILRTAHKDFLPVEQRKVSFILMILACFYLFSYIEHIEHIEKENYMFQRSSGDTERWLSIVQGWRLFVENPVFGGGLGAYIHQRIINEEKIIMIHSIPVWLLAEFGLFGTCLIIYLFYRVFRRSLYLLKYEASNPYAFGVLGLILCLFIAGLVHDFFYQRLFWFLLGIFMAVQPGNAIWDSDLPLKKYRLGA